MYWLNSLIPDITIFKRLVVSDENKKIFTLTKMNEIEIDKDLKYEGRYFLPMNIMECKKSRDTNNSHLNETILYSIVVLDWLNLYDERVKR
jgi:hypothetical protein